MFRVSTESPFTAYYKLGIDNEGATILFNIPNGIWEKTVKNLHAFEFRSFLKQTLRISNFIVPGELPWGYGPIFIDGLPAIQDWHQIRCELPCFVDSNGSIRDDAWERGCAIVASIKFLIMCLQQAQRSKHAKTHHSQLMELIVSVRAESDGRRRYGIAAGLSAACCNWITQQDKRAEAITISKCMEVAYRRMLLNRAEKTVDTMFLRCGAEIGPNCSVSLSVPGDRTGIGTYTNSRDRFGIDMYDHNVDTSMQLLTLLVGLAALCKEFETSIK